MPERHCKIDLNLHYAYLSILYSKDLLCIIYLILLIPLSDSSLRLHDFSGIKNDCIYQNFISMYGTFHCYLSGLAQ